MGWPSWLDHEMKAMSLQNRCRNATCSTRGHQRRAFALDAARSDVQGRLDFTNPFGRRASQPRKVLLS